LNADADQNTVGCHKEEKKTNPPQTTTKDIQKHKNNKTCEKCDPMKNSSRRYSKDTTAEGVATERESTLTAIHRCHRPRIPIGHVRIERR